MRNLRIQKIAIAWILALMSTVPILFMVWLSVLNADDINQSFFFPQNRTNRITFFAPQENKETEIAATSLGSIYEFSQTSNYSGKKITDINSVATAYAQNKSLWAFSANRGLVEIDLEKKIEKKSYGWDFFEKNYKDIDPSRFFVSNDILPENFAWLANNLNFSPALPSNGDTTISELVGIKFYTSEQIIGQLNNILADGRKLDKIINYWNKWDGWLNPQIHNLFETRNISEKEKKLLFRFCLSELFPNKISRFKYFPWQDIWVSQIANSGLSILAVDDKIIMGVCGGFFPGIAVFDTETKQITAWITEAGGLPSTSIQSIVPISDHEILATHDLGFSIIQFNAEKVTHNFMFGEYELPYLDGQNLYTKVMPNDKIFISHETGSITFDFRNFKTEFLPEQKTVSPLISYYYENEEGKWLGYSDGKLEVLNNSDSLLRTSVIPKGKRAFQWSNYQDITQIMPLTLFIKNSLFISVSISLLCTLLAIFPSYAVARLEFFRKSVLSKIIFSSQVLSSLPFLIPIFVIFVILQMKSFQMFNNFSTIILVNTAFFLPLTVQFMYNMFKAIPSNLEECAMIDGCTPWKAFWRVIIPAAVPALATCLIYIFLFTWDEIMLIWILSTDSSTATLPVGIRMTIGQMANRPELLMAFSVIASLPPIILFAFAHPFLLRSLSMHKK